MVLGIPSVGIAKSLLTGRVGSGEEGFAKIVQSGRTVGFVVETRGVTRYWSPGYSVSLEELKMVIRGYAPACLRAMVESDRAAREQVRVG